MESGTSVGEAGLESGTGVREAGERVGEPGLEWGAKVGKTGLDWSRGQRSGRMDWTGVGGKGRGDWTELGARVGETGLESEKKSGSRTGGELWPGRRWCGGPRLATASTGEWQERRPEPRRAAGCMPRCRPRTGLKETILYSPCRLESFCHSKVVEAGLNRRTLFRQGAFLMPLGIKNAEG